MLLDYDSRFAFQIQANNPNFSYPAHFHAIYTALHRRNVAVDVIAGSADFQPLQAGPRTRLSRAA